MNSKIISKHRSVAARQQNWLCYYCKLPMLGRGSPYSHNEIVNVPSLLVTAEHLIARQDGGRDTQFNIVAAHAICNKRRHHRKLPLSADKYVVHVTVRINRGCWFGTEQLRLLIGDLNSSAGCGVAPPPQFVTAANAAVQNCHGPRDTTPSPG